MTNRRREWSEGQLEDDVLEVARLLSKRSRSRDDTRELLYLFDWYCHQSSSSYRSIPLELIRYIASELKKYADNRKYRPFPAKTGRPEVIDWDKIDGEVRLLSEFQDLDDPDQKTNLRRLFRGVVEPMNAYQRGELDDDTLEKHIRLFAKNNPDLI